MPCVAVKGLQAKARRRYSVTLAVLSLMNRTNLSTSIRGTGFKLSLGVKVRPTVLLEPEKMKFFADEAG